jgi:hypothetical protein
MRQLPAMFFTRISLTAARFTLLRCAWAKAWWAIHRLAVRAFVSAIGLQAASSVSNS